MTKKSDEEYKKILENLTPREHKVLEGRFGIDLSDTSSLEAVGRQFDITRERIRQIEKKARSKLKNKAMERKSDDALDGPLCSFCGKTKSEVNHLISSGNKAKICDECVDLCVEILNDLDD